MVRASGNLHEVPLGCCYQSHDEDHVVFDTMLDTRPMKRRHGDASTVH